MERWPGVNNLVVAGARYVLGMRDYRELLDTLRSDREREGLSQDDVAHKVVARGLERQPRFSLISNWERDGAKPDVFALVCWADVFDRDVELVPRKDAELRRTRSLTARAAGLADHELEWLLRLVAAVRDADAESVDIAERVLRASVKRAKRAGAM